MNGFLDDMPELELPQGRRRRRPKRETKDENRETTSTVIFQRVKCPQCESPDVPVQHTDPKVGTMIIRRHKCNQCGHAFKSVEKTSP